MAISDQLLYGTYVGLVIDSEDPDKLGRVKVIVPGKTGPLFKGWNETTQDIKFSSATSSPFDAEIMDRLSSVLPWARPSTPFFGGGTGSPVNSSSGLPAVHPTEQALNGANRTGSASGDNTAFTPAGVNTDYSVMTHAIDPKYIVLHDTSGNDLITSTNNGGNFYNYVIKDGVAYQIAPAGQYAGHAVAFNNKSIGIARVGMEGQPLSQADAAALSSLISQLSQKYNIPAERIITHPEGGPSATTHGGKDPKEANWKNQVLAQSNLGSPDGFKNASPDNRYVANDGLNNKGGEFSQYRPYSDSNPDNCNANPDGGTLSYQQALGISTILNRAHDTTGMSISYSPNGQMDKQSVINYAIGRLKCSPLLTAKIDPAEAALYHITNTHDPAQWADFVYRTAYFEQGGNIAAHGYDTTHDPGGSWGGWSNSVADTEKYAGYTGKSIQDLQTNPNLACNTIISQIENEVCRRNTINGLDNGVFPGAGGGSWASNTLRNLRGEGSPDGSGDSRNLVQCTTQMGQNSYASLNIGRFGGPAGYFSIPNRGAKVWVTFEGGSPQRPIYMGQVYEPGNYGAVS